MPESCRDRPTKAHEYVFLLTKSGRYFFDQDAVRNPSGANTKTVWTITTQPFPEAHFATFPEALPERCIRAGTSERGCCQKCGAPWERVVKRSNPTRTKKTGIGVDSFEGTKGRGGDVNIITTGWQPSCTCPHLDRGKVRQFTDQRIDEHGSITYLDDPPTIPCTVLDPFVGSGTTAIVAVRLGRKAIGIDLNPSYAAMVEKQLAVVAPGSPRRPKKFRLKKRKKIVKPRRPGAS